MLERAGDDRGDAGVADPDVDATPLGPRGLGDGSLNSSSVTSPRHTSAGPASSAADLLEGGLGAGDQRHRGAGLREGVGEHPAEASAGTGEHHPLAPDFAPRGKERGSRSVRSWPFPVLYRPVQYLVMFSDDDLLEMHRRMLVIRGFETRVSALYRRQRDPRLRPPVDRARRPRRWARAGRCAPADVITSTHRGHGHCLAKGLDPLGMFAELMAKDAGTNRGRGGSMHIADPDLGIFGANGIVAAGLPIAVGAATAAQLRDDAVGRGRVLRRRRRGPGGVPRGGEPRRGVAAARRLLLREQRVRRVLLRGRPARRHPRAPGRRLRRSTTSRSTATTSSRPRRRWASGRRGARRARPRRRRGHHLPVARSLRGRPAALPDARRAEGVGGARPAGGPRGPPS